MSTYIHLRASYGTAPQEKKTYYTPRILKTSTACAICARTLAGGPPIPWSKQHSDQHSASTKSRSGPGDGCCCLVCVRCVAFARPLGRAAFLGPPPRSPLFTIPTGGGEALAGGCGGRRPGQREGRVRGGAPTRHWESARRRRIGWEGAQRTQSEEAPTLWFCRRMNAALPPPKEMWTALCRMSSVVHSEAFCHDQRPSSSRRPNRRWHDQIYQS
jgi:hypothetical protein